MALPRTQDRRQLDTDRLGLALKPEAPAGSKSGSTAGAARETATFSGGAVCREQQSTLRTSEA